MNNFLRQLFVYVPDEVQPRSCFILYMSLFSCSQLALISPGFRFVVRLAQRETACRVQTDAMNDLFCMLCIS